MASLQRTRLMVFSELLTVLIVFAAFYRPVVRIEPGPWPNPWQRISITDSYAIGDNANGL